MKVHTSECAESLLHCVVGMCMKAHELKIRRLEMSGLFPLHASLGVMSTKARMGVTLWMWTVYQIVSY